MPFIRKLRSDAKEEDLLKPAAIAETCRCLIHQDRSAWTHELDVGPFKKHSRTTETRCRAGSFRYRRVADFNHTAPGSSPGRLTIFQPDERTLWLSVSRSASITPIALD